MKAEMLLKKAESYFPLSLSDKFCEKFDAYDNSGLIMDSGAAFDKVLFCLDLSKAALDYAEKNKIKAVITHHPFIYKPIKNIGADATTANLARAAAMGLTVVSMHLNADVAVGGIDESLAFAIGGVKMRIAQPISRTEGYGRIFKIEEIALGSLVEKIKNTIGTKRVVYYGTNSTLIQNVGSFCGGGSSTALEFAPLCDLVVTADMPHHIITALTDMNKSIILLTHYASENYGFKRFYEKFAADNKALECFYFEDKRLL